MVGQSAQSIDGRAAATADVHCTAGFPHIRQLAAWAGAVHHISQQVQGDWRGRQSSWVNNSASTSSLTWPRVATKGHLGSGHWGIQLGHLRSGFESSPSDRLCSMHACTPKSSCITHSLPTFSQKQILHMSNLLSHAFYLLSLTRVQDFLDQTQLRFHNLRGSHPQLLLVYISTIRSSKI